MVYQYPSKTWWSRIKSSLLINILFFGVVGAVGYGFFNTLERATTLYRESAALEEKSKEFVKKKEKLEAAIREWDTVEAKEREAKDKLNLKKPGEEVVVVVPEKKDENINVHAASSTNFWARVKKFFFK